MRDVQQASDSYPAATLDTHAYAGRCHLDTIPADDTHGDRSLFVVTFCTGSVQIALRGRCDQKLVGVTVFRSHTVEHGRENFRVHLAYFESAAKAQQTLAVVRRYYPNAWVSAVPRNNLRRESCLDLSDLGSFDDTMNAAPSTIRRATARGVTPTDVARRPSVAAGATTGGQRRLIEPQSAAGPQHYVVQLDWSTMPINSTTVPRLALFHAYSLYQIRTIHEGRSQHAIRLGFFPTVDGAQQVAEHVRGPYPRVSVAPVSDREVARVVERTRRARDARATVESRRRQPATPNPSKDTVRTKPAAPIPPADRPGARLPDPVSQRLRERRAVLSLTGAHRLGVDKSRDSRASDDAQERPRSGWSASAPPPEARASTAPALKSVDYGAACTPPTTLPGPAVPARRQSVPRPR
jgi:hypothetical protein